MKKLVFALEVFSIIAVFISYLILEINHEHNKPPATIFYPSVKLEKTMPIPQEFVSINDQLLVPHAVK